MVEPKRAPRWEDIQRLLIARNLKWVASLLAEDLWEGGFAVVEPHLPLAPPIGHDLDELVQRYGGAQESSSLAPVVADDDRRDTDQRPPDLGDVLNSRPTLPGTGRKV